MSDDTTHSGSNLENKIGDKESKGFMRKAFDLTFNTAVAVGTTAFGLATVGTAAPIVAAAFAGGGVIGSMWKKKETGQSLYEIIDSGLKTYSSVNAVFYPMTLLGDFTYPLVSDIGASIAGSAGSFIAKSAYAVTGFNMAFVGAFKGAYHLIDNKFDPSGLGKAIATDYWPLTKRIATVFAPGYILAANGFPDIGIGQYKVPTFAVNALPVGIYNAVHPPKPSAKESHAGSLAAHAPAAATA